jgi:hypothetical protein
VFSICAVNNKKKILLNIMGHVRRDVIHKVWVFFIVEVIEGWKNLQYFFKKKICQNVSAKELVSKNSVMIKIFMFVYKTFFYFILHLVMMCKTKKKKHSFHYVFFCNLIILLIRSTGISVVTLCIRFEYLGKMSEWRVSVIINE